MLVHLGEELRAEGFHVGDSLRMVPHNPFHRGKGERLLLPTPRMWRNSKIRCNIRSHVVLDHRGNVSKGLRELDGHAVQSLLLPHPVIKVVSSFLVDP